MEFSGAVAAAYAEHRRGYPPPVLDLLVAALGLPGTRPFSTSAAAPGS